MKILCVTHSARPFYDARVGLNFLSGRFPEGRLDDLPPFETLPSIQQAVPFTGALTLWSAERAGDRAKLTLLYHHDPDYKIQCAAFVGERLAILGSDRIEILNSSFESEATITDPWLAGGHTIYPAGPDEVWVSSAPANAMLRVSLSGRKVVETRSVPAIYGKGYPLTRQDDLLRHYIPTDLQPTHLNSVVPTENGLLLTLWIPGAVGLLDDSGHYREIIRGLVGCHGARPCRDDGNILVTDSAAGHVCFIDSERGTLLRRLDLNSRWVHDVEEIGDGMLAATIGDANELRLIDKRSGETLLQQDCTAFGASTMFVTAHDVDPRWEKALLARTPEVRVADETLIPTQGKDLVASQLDLGSLRKTHNGLAVNVRLRTEQPVGGEYLMLGEILSLSEPTCLFQVEAQCRKGEATIGLVDAGTLEWLVQCPIDSVRDVGQGLLRLAQPGHFRIAVAANNPGKPSHLDVEIRKVSLKVLTPTPSASGWAGAIPNWGYGGRGRAVGHNLLPEIDRGKWLIPENGVTEWLAVISEKPSLSETLMKSDVFTLKPGKYEFSGHMDCVEGSIMMGLLDNRRKEWLKQLVFTKAQDFATAEVRIETPIIVQFHLATHNLALSRSYGVIRSASLRRVLDGAVQDNATGTARWSWIPRRWIPWRW